MFPLGYTKCAGDKLGDKMSCFRRLCFLDACFRLCYWLILYSLLVDRHLQYLLGLFLPFWPFGSCFLPHSACWGLIEGSRHRLTILIIENQSSCTNKPNTTASARAAIVFKISACSAAWWDFTIWRSFH